MKQIAIYNEREDVIHKPSDAESLGFSFQTFGETKKPVASTGLTTGYQDAPDFAGEWVKSLAGLPNTGLTERADHALRIAVHPLVLVSLKPTTVQGHDRLDRQPHRIDWRILARQWPVSRHGSAVQDFLFRALAAALKSARRANSEVVSPSAAAADSTCPQLSSSMRKYRLGVWPVAGLPRPRFSSVVVFMPRFYGHPQNCQMECFVGRRIIGR